jgi:transcriptional antiterminator Rof (Rho-off)
MRTKKGHGWYLAEEVLEIRVAGDERNVVHVNTRLLQARDGEEAYAKAAALGAEAADEYLNPEGQQVTITFRGLREVVEIQEQITDGSEIRWQESVAVPERKIRAMLLRVDEVEAVKPFEPKDHPDYRCGEVVAEAMAMLVKKK